MSHLLSQSPLTLGWRYRAARDNKKLSYCKQYKRPTLILLSRFAVYKITFTVTERRGKRRCSMDHNVASC